MNRAGIAVVASLASLAGCAHSQSPLAASAATPGVERADPRADAVAPVAEGLPPSEFPPFSGWLAFATVEHGKGQWYWSPTRPGAEVVHFSSGWSEVEKGTRFAAATADGEAALTYLGTEEIPYGCETNAQTVAVFDAERPVPEGPVWISPGPMADVVVLPVERLPVEKGAQQRRWRVGGLELLAVKTAPRAGELKVLRDGSLIDTRSFDKPEMAGADDTPLELADEDEVGLLKPLVGWRIGADELVVLGRRSYEGHSFELLALRDGRLVEVEGGVGLYFCAF